LKRAGRSVGRLQHSVFQIGVEMEHSNDNDCPCGVTNFFSFSGRVVYVHDYSDENYIPPARALVLSIRLLMLDAQTDRVGDPDEMIGRKRKTSKGSLD
jgi:hypothetical protein